MSDKDTLLGMGFDPARVAWALKATNNRGLQPAMDHILENEGKPVPDLSAPPAPSASNDMDVDEDGDEQAEAAALSGGGDPQAKSLICQECNKSFRNAELANFHASKSGHTNFAESTEEIKPLTPEEKAARLAELREKMAIKRAKKAEEEARENKVNEAIRRKAGKDLVQIKEDLKLKQAMQEAEQKKREKIEDAKARTAIKAQIEADKRARAEKAAREKALREGRAVPDAASTSAPAAASHAAPSTGVAGRDFKETRLQIRMASGGGGPWTTTLSSDAPLREVAEFVAGQTLSVDVDSVSFAQHFPRKQFARSDFSKTLRELGLTPSAVLIAS
ncbi:hypothetical protein PLICRDRAFT_165647 [Plicaturopsis crispa FD-325 SS-3]|nr:hypothetical protein PLICRDRAFT_165647 [Plicaturopsis crispa FD-325 SS-3]